MTSRPEELVVATCATPTGCGTRYETLTADGQVHVDARARRPSRTRGRASGQRTQ